MLVVQQIKNFGKIDFSGQELVSRLSTILLVFFMIASIAVGQVFQDISLVFYTYLAGSVITVFLVTFPLPMYNKNPVTWLSKKDEKK
ncbi:putative signal peptidase complex subunit 1 [Zancudomyces culisetae]|uniref:Signal peptidase complex subunit 1 n=1 Tax=Zancudomyces culisetae TaxID=1213189 RepID=A0A1R1PWC9_ZANCU|nr:putative signal peptidase complex subunit 1 [Zancudomyces culisetae]|eukprot:OMH85270.1 putative signal peptidase complex subunit 1 [Zancudomyces culisetae]